MIGWRRRAKAARDDTVSQERLYELVNQTLMENFGPLGSFAITRRSAADTDDIFHTALARSVAHDIVANLAEHGISVRSSLSHAAAPLTPVDAVYVPRQLARAVSAAAPAPAPVAAPAPTLTLAPAAVATAGPDPEDDDALRSLVAHHRAVTEAAAQKNAEGGWSLAR
jgi:hypothetical protein